MISFIPAWYQTNEWRENEQIWFKNQSKSEMDDAVKQIQLFHRNGAYEYQIISLGLTPNFRHFLHRQGLYRASYWSCFDAIQSVKRKKAAVLSFHSLNWPKNIEFFYSAFVVVALLNGEKYAQIGFGEDGNLIQIDLFKNGQISRKNIYDDRGFISCTIVYENGKKNYELYLNESGVWVICRFADGHVAVNAKNNKYLISYGGKEEQIPFKKQTYLDISEIIKEVLASYLKHMSEKNIFCVAMHEQHTEMLNELLKGRKTILSFYENRIKDISAPLVREMIENSDHIVADSNKNEKQIAKTYGLSSDFITNIPPYDTRVDFGISQKLHIQKVLITVDSLSDDIFEKVVIRTAEYMQKNKNARIVFFTRNPNNDKKQILVKTQEILKQNDFDEDWAREAREEKAEFFIDGQDKPILYEVALCVDIPSVSRCVREQRLMVELASEPDMFLQISCISMGIPQIVRDKNEYVEAGKNGLINKDINKLDDDIDFYLGSLTNWNHAMISAYEIGKRYTTGKLVSRWNEVINKVENSKGAPTGRL